MRRDDGPQFEPHLAGIAFGRRKVIGELDFAFVHAPHLVNGELRPVVKDLNDAFDLDEIVAFEFVQDVGHVVPHLGVEFAGTVGQEEREIELAAPPFFCRISLDWTRKLVSIT